MMQRHTLLLAYYGVLILAFAGNFNYESRLASFLAMSWWIGKAMRHA